MVTVEFITRMMWPLPSAVVRRLRSSSSKTSAAEWQVESFPKMTPTSGLFRAARSSLASAMASSAAAHP